VVAKFAASEAIAVVAAVPDCAVIRLMARPSRLKMPAADPNGANRSVVYPWSTTTVADANTFVLAACAVAPADVPADVAAPTAHAAKTVASANLVNFRPI
jgi:hypothetical protein